MKYDPLKDYLKASDQTAVPLSFEQIEQILGAPLPASARKHAAWWSNNPTNHANAKAWLEAGYASQQVDLRSERLVFAQRSTESTLPPGMREPAAELLKPPGAGFVERLQARLGGTVWIAPGVDLTAPTDETWDGEVE